LQYLNPSAQEDALDTVWDPDTNCPISWEEQQVREAGTDDTVPEWVQDTSQADGTTTAAPSGEGLLSISIICPTTPSASDYKALNKARPRVLKQRSNNNKRQPHHPPLLFQISTQPPEADDDIMMGESIINDRVVAVETSVSNMEGTVSSLAMSIQTLLLQLQQNQQQPPLGNAAKLPESLAPGA
jgi:hypothetical protein